MEETSHSNIFARGLSLDVDMQKEKGWVKTNNNCCCTLCYHQNYGWNYKILPNNYDAICNSNMYTKKYWVTSFTISNQQ